MTRNIILPDLKILQQQRHTGMYCRYPEYMEVVFVAFPGYWIPAIPAGTTEYGL